MSVDQIVQLIQSAIQFGTVILFGAMGEILTEKSGNLNLGVPGMMYMGGFFSGVDFATAVGENPVMGLCIGACVALVVAACMFLPRKLMNLGGFVEAMSEGVRSMIGAIMILVLAWSLGGCCRYLLGTGEFVSGFLNGLGVGLGLLPAIIVLAMPMTGTVMLETMFGSASRRISRFINEGFNVSQR